MKKYEMYTFTNEKIFEVILNGFFQQEDAKQFVTDYTSNVKALNPKDTTMIIDCKKLSTIKADLIPDLEQCYKLYMSTGFKRIIFVCPDSSLGTSQLKRVGRNVNITADFVSSREEAVSLSKS